MYPQKNAIPRLGLLIIMLFVNFSFLIAQALSSSNLPIIIINTNGQIIPDEPKITAHLGIIDNGFGVRNYITDSFNNYNGYIGIEKRGSSSLNWSRSSYNIETCDSVGNQIKTSIMGMPAESDWCLISQLTDKTLLRNFLAYSYSGMMGNYATRVRHCEVILRD